MSKTGGQWLSRARATFADPVLLGVAIVLALVPAVFDARLYDDFTLPKQALLIGTCGAILLPGLLFARGSVLPTNRVVRWAFFAFCGWTLVAWAAGIDPRGSLLGVYQYRQGALTFACYAVLFVAGSHLARRPGSFQKLAIFGLVGLTAATIYTIVQSTGNDPVEWWIDTTVRAIGTIGNANELASYAMVTLAFGGAFLAKRRAGPVVLGLVAGSVTLIVLESESRTGIVAMAAFALLVPALCLLVRTPGRRTGVLSAVVVGGMLAGGLLSSGLGAGASAPAGRVRSGLEGSDSSGSTRVSLVKGTIPAITANPITGAGPDGLLLAFAEHRPAGLTGTFEQYDLGVQSSHNWPLDTAANLGLPGIVALLALLLACGWVSLRGGLGSADPSLAVTWAGMLAYGAMTLANPLSIAGHAIFWLLLGWLASRPSESPVTEAAVERTRAWLLPKAAFASVVAVPALAVAILMPVADLEADEGWDDYASGNFAAAAEHYERAHNLLPIARDYRSREGRAWLAAGVSGDISSLERAESVLTKLGDEYSLNFDDAIALATAKIGLERPPEEIEAVIDTAFALNPNGIYAVDYTARLREAAQRGGVLEYEEERRWVFVTPLP